MAERSVSGEAKTYRILVLANAEPGRESEFDAWYSERHVPEILRTSGFKSAQRFQLSAAQVSAEPLPHRYVTIYELETLDIQAALDALAARRAAGQITPTDSIAPGALAYVLESMTELIAPPTVSEQQGN